MSADFIAGYVSGAIGIIVGNPLDLIKTRLQATASPPTITRSMTPSSPTPTLTPPPTTFRQTFTTTSTLVRGATAPILGYGALNALLFVSYNRTLSLLDPTHTPTTPSTNLTNIYMAGCVGGLATFIVSAPTELIKCRAQVANANLPGGIPGGSGQATGSFQIAKEIWQQKGVRGLYFGGGVTSLRDAVGYGFYFWSYEMSRQVLSSHLSNNPNDDGVRTSSAMEVLLCGGIAGMVTWASIFPLDMIKTRVQTQPSLLPNATAGHERSPLLVGGEALAQKGQTKGAVQIATETYRNEGLRPFFRGLGVCTVRGFIVNAVQWFVYEWVLRVLQPGQGMPSQAMTASVERL